MAGSNAAAWEGKQALRCVTASLNSHIATGAFHLPHTLLPALLAENITHYRITKWTISMKNGRD